jgi:hypothetical protein
VAAYNQKYQRSPSDSRRGAAPDRALGANGAPKIVQLSDWIRVDAVQIAAPPTSQWLVTYGDGSQIQMIQIMNGLFTRCFELVT